MSRNSLIVHGFVATIIGLLSLTLLLIAPLGLAAVITLTAFLTLISFVGGIVAERILRWIEPPASNRRPSLIQLKGSRRRLLGSRGN